MMKKRPPKIPVEKNHLLRTSADQNLLMAQLSSSEMSLTWEQPKDVSKADHRHFSFMAPEP